MAKVPREGETSDDRARRVKMVETATEVRERTLMTLAIVLLLDDMLKSALPLRAAAPVRGVLTRVRSLMRAAVDAAAQSHREARNLSTEVRRRRT